MEEAVGKVVNHVDGMKAWTPDQDLDRGMEHLVEWISNEGEDCQVGERFAKNLIQLFSKQYL